MKYLVSRMKYGKGKKRNDLKGQELPHVKQALRVWNNFHSRVRNNINYSTVTICDDWYRFSDFLLLVC